MKGFTKSAQDRYVVDLVSGRGFANIRRAEWLLTLRTVDWYSVERALLKAELCARAIAQLGWVNDDLERRAREMRRKVEAKDVAA
jgi:hypothetical protein